MYFIGEVIKKHRVFLTSNEGTVKKSTLYTLCELSARKTEYLDRFRIQCDSSKVLPGDT
jgi:hypothetical protein